MSKPRINTMEELSIAIGVSRPTLSRYFQDPSLIKANTAARIEAGLAQVEYVPNFFATRLNRKSTGMIGVIIPYFNDLFFTRLLQCIEISAMDAGLTVITQCSHSDPVIEARAAETLMSMNVDGAVMIPLGNQSDRDVQRRLQERLPFVMVDSHPETMPDVNYVGTDHVQSTRLMIDYLCRIGPPPALLAMPPVNFNARRREMIYTEYMQELGHEPEIIGNYFMHPDWHYEAHGEAVMDESFGRGAYVDRSILCANDRVAIGALRAASRHGLVPRRGPKGGLRIAGHDDYPLCPFTVPALTTVAQDFEAIGKAAVSRLVRLIGGVESGSPPEITLFHGALKLRESA